MQKKGQMTIYVVIGITILVLIILLVSLRETIFVSEWERQRQEALEVPDRVKVLQNFVLDCVELTAQESLALLGIQGGYITLPEDTIPPGPFNQFSNSLSLFGNRDFETSYWFYRSANGIMKNNVPSLEDMESELSIYMNENLASCTLNFSLFQDFNVSVGSISTETEIRDNRVLFTIEYPIQVMVEGFVFSFNSFYEDVDSSIGRMYKVASSLMDEINENNFLEEFTIDILSVNENIPFSNTEQSCRPLFWNMDEIERSLRSDLENNIPNIKLEGSDYLKKQQYFEWNAVESNIDNLDVNLRYSRNWPMAIEAHPSENGILKAEPFNEPSLEEMAYVSSFLCLIDYNFIYDITYPVLITLSDPEGYIFQFATQVIIDNNQPRQNVLGTEDFPETKTRICEGKVTPVNVYAIDTENYQPVNDARIKLKCVSTVCDLGLTDFDEIGSARLSTNSPACVNAELSAEKDGYHKGKEIVDTTGEADFTIFMDKYWTFDYNIILVEESGYAREPEPEETVILSLFEEEKEHAITLISEQEDNTVKLIPGDYNYMATVSRTSDLGFFIDGKTVDTCVEIPQSGLMGAFFGFKEEHCYTAEMEGTTIDNVNTGGAKFEFSLTPEMMEDKKEVTFYIPVWNEPKTHEGIFAIQEYIEAQSRITLPEFE